MFGMSLKKMRLFRDLTQTEIGGKCGMTGNYICRIEKGKANLSAQNMHWLTVELGFNYDVTLTPDNSWKWVDDILK